MISISSTERPILDFARERIAFTYSIGNRQALKLLLQIEPFLRSYKRQRAALVRDCYVLLTPRNGKYTPELLAARKRFEDDVLSLRANSVPARLEDPCATIP